MPTLHELQKGFLDTIYHGAQRRIPNIEIYRQSVFGGLQKALDETYPVSKQLVGETFFQALCKRFIRQTPSTSPDINKYGRNFGNFTEQFPPAQGLPYLADVMRLEWAWHHALQCQDDDIMPLEELLQLDEQTLQNITLTVSNSLTLIKSDYPVLEIWHVNQPDYHGDQHVCLDDGGQTLAVWRQQQQIVIEETSKPLWHGLNIIKNKKPLSQFQQLYHYQDILIEIMQRGLICGFSQKPNNF